MKKRFALPSRILWAVACVLLVNSFCLADDVVPEPRSPVKAEDKDVTVDFVLKTKFAKEESYLLLIPQSVIDEAAGKASTSTTTKIKTLFAGIAISLAVLSGLILLRRRNAAGSYRKTAVAAALMAIMLFGALPFAIGDVAPREPAPVEDQVTVKIVKGGDAVELIRYVRTPKRHRSLPPDELKGPRDGASPDSDKR